MLFTRHEPDDRIYYFSAGDFPGISIREFSFQSKKGHRINGWFYNYQGCKTDRIVVFDHGLAPWHRSYFREIETLCRHGYIVYTFDHTGCGASEGENIMGLCGSVSDLDDCLNALKGIEEIRSFKIYVVGHSRGGYSTINIPALHPEVSGVVAMSAFTSLRTMQRQVTPFILAPFRTHIFNLEQANFPDYVNICAQKTLLGCDIPALIIHSSDDSSVGCRANFMKLKKALSDRPNTEFLLLCDRDHNPTYTKEAVEYKKSFFKFYSKYKKKKPNDPDLPIIALFDWHKMTEQDMDVWNKIFEFLDK